MASSYSQTVTILDLKKYDVFISFRGEDTRFGFTSHLHTALKQKMRPYIDNMLEKGEQVWTELVEAIKDSTMFLVVFSENYASSTWCLNELVEMMECHRKGQGVVIPVFYQIDPSHVRKQTGSYGTALAKHKNGDKMMQNWNNALFQAANLSGFHSTSYRTESDLIEDITRAVLAKLNHNNTNELKCKIILDENYRKIQSFIKQIDSSEVQIIGLWGMGGIGKTTLAAELFDKLSFQYEGRYFFENVTEVSTSHGINYTCKELLSKLLREDVDIDTSKVIPSMIIRRLKRMKSFIVLDDVRTSELLQNLIGVGHGWLGYGSTVIVTTRDKHVLISAGIEKIHQVKKMNSQNSLQLFSLNAFHKVLPKEEYVELSKRAIGYADGNPLALKVLGSFLRCKSEIEWKCALAKLKEIPIAKIDRILKWSYDELDDKEKNIFLDIACVLKGYNRNRVTKLLNECGFFADIGISRLLDMALIRIDFKNCIQMHDLIQAMGKQIVLEESPKNPGERSRICDPNEVCDVLKNNRGTKNVEAIILDANEHTNINLSRKAFEKMVNLRLLVFRDHKGIISINLPHGFDCLPENLRFFSWDGYSLKSPPSTFSHKMLVELSLQESRVEKLWNGEMDLPNLEILDLYSSKKLIECPNVSGSPNLKDVTLSFCENLTEIDSSIFLLQKLEELCVYGCSSLKSLSSNTCSPALVLLDATYCNNLREFSISLASPDHLILNLNSWNGNELPSSLLNTKNLGRFSFPLIECLVDLPENFANDIFLEITVDPEHDPSIILHKVFPSPAFITLKHLCLSGSYPTLSEIPDNIYLLSSLESLSLEHLAITSLPENIKYLPQLLQLNVLNCEMLQFIPALSLNLVNFSVFNCESLETMLSSMGETYDKPNPCTVVLPNCKKLDPHSYQTVLEDAIFRIELGANERDNIIQYLLPVLPGIEYWFDYRSTQVSFTLELPPNLLGFAYYLVISQGSVSVVDVSIGCDCYLHNISGERIYITSSRRDNIFTLSNSYPLTIHMKSDHVVFWYDPVSCKQIMEEIKSISNDANSTSYNPKLTFRFFFDENVYDEVVIQECGFRWIYQGEMVSPTNFELNDQEETIHSSKELQQRVSGTPSSSMELDETKDTS